MPKVTVHEVRKLLVPIDTAVDAVLDLDSEQGGALAFGTIVEAQIETEPEPGLAIVVQRRGTDTVERRKFEPAILAAAFIRYCWKCRIPLPRHGSKRIEVGPDGFLFTIEGTVEVVRRHGGLPQRNGHVPPSHAGTPGRAAPGEPQAPPADTAAEVLEEAAGEAAEETAEEAVAAAAG
ncbi:MAG: hypothetical protein ACRETB_04785 [Steroidobacteraceae bacterium]